MSKRKDFEEFCRRTRPPMRTDRDLYLSGKGDYTNIETRGAWKAWQYLTKERSASCKSVIQYGKTPDCKQCDEAESCRLTDCPECGAKLCEDINGTGVRDHDQ